MKRIKQNTRLEATLSDLRKKIHRTDQAILDLLVQRHNLSITIAEVKQVQQVPVRQQAVWNKKCQELTSDYSSKGLDPDFIKALLTLLHEESIHTQKAALKTKT